MEMRRQVTVSWDSGGSDEAPPKPIRRPSSQPTFSSDCISAPSLHHCQQHQRFASQLSLCIGNSHPSSPSSPSHPPAPSFSSSPLNFPHQFVSSPVLEPSSPPLQRSPHYKSSLSQKTDKLNADLNFSPLWLPHTYTDPHPRETLKTRPLTNSTRSRPWHFSPLLPQPNPNFDSSRCSLSDVCHHKQSASSPNPEASSFPTFHPETQTNPGAAEPSTQHTAVRSGWSTPPSPSHTENILSVSCNSSPVSRPSPSPMSTTHTSSALPSSEGAISRPFQPSRPGYPSPRSSEGFYPSPQHPGHYQMAAYPGPHTLPSVPSASYPPQAAMVDTHHAHTHPRHHVHSHSQLLPQPHGTDMALWGSAAEKPDTRSSRGSSDREESGLQPPTGNQHIYQPVGKAEHVVPPKKPPRPGAQSHVGSSACLNTGDSYNDGVKPWRLQPQEISPPPTANSDRSNDKVYENVTGLVKAVIEMSSKIQPAPPEEYVPMVKDVGLASRTLLATVDETLPQLPASTHREIEMAQKSSNSDSAESIGKMKLAQQYVMTSLQQDYKKQMSTAAHALAVDAKNSLDVIDQSRLRMMAHSRPH